MIKPYTKARQAGRSAMSASEFKATTESEAHLQTQCEEWLEIQGIEYVRIPNEIYRLAANADPRVRGAISRSFKGLPDLMIFKPCGNLPGRNDALFIELKTAKGKLSGGQKTFSRHLNVLVIRSFEEFVNTVELWLNENE
jgi:hypothetical protein